MKPPIPFILLLSLCTAVLALYPVHYKPGVRGMEQSGYETLAVAESLVQGTGFSNPFGLLPTGPTAHVSPTYPALLAVILSNTPDQSSALFAIEWSATLVVMLQVCLLPWLGLKMGLGFYSGVVAAVAWLVARMPREEFWEQNYSGLLITLLAFFMYKGLTGTLERWQLVLCGVLWGVLILTCPVAILALFLWLVLLYRARVHHPGKPTAGLLGTPMSAQISHTQMSHAQKAVLLLLPILVVAPWMIRNYKTFHKFVFVRDNLGLEMEVSNNPCATFSFELNRISGCYSEHHPNESLSEAMAVRELGEIGYNQRSMARAKAWIRANPSEFLKLTAKRSVAFWLPTMFYAELSAIPNPEFYSALRDAVVSLASLAAPAGLVLLWKRNRAAASVLLIWLLTFPVVYYLTQYGERARIPVMWAILLPAGYASTELGRWLLSIFQREVHNGTSVGVEH